jgi:type I restriction enzyme, R subunit
MRRYQYLAAHAISDRVSKADWSQNNIRGGHIWHTTGSGKTMTSFKSAQLIANPKNADKVLFSWVCLRIFCWACSRTGISGTQ